MEKEMLAIVKILKSLSKRYIIFTPILLVIVVAQVETYSQLTTSGTFGAIQSMLLLQTEDGRVQAALTWLIGSLNSRGWSEIKLAGPPIVFALIMALLLSRQLNLLGLNI